MVKGFFGFGGEKTKDKEDEAALKKKEEELWDTESSMTKS